MKISVILTTKNNIRTIRQCLESIENNRTKDYEIIIVDNYSTDWTKEIIEQFATQEQIFVYYKWPERNIQRPYAFSKSSWDIIYFIDSDMYLEDLLLDEIQDYFFRKPKIEALIIKETNTWGTSFWSKVKAFERSLYQWDDDIEAARVFSRSLYEQLWGYNQNLISWEDWDLSDRARKLTKIWRTRNGVLHDEWEIIFSTLMQKKFYYGSKFTSYMEANPTHSKAAKIYFFRKSFYTNWRQYVLHPLLFLGFIVMICSSICFFSLWYFKWKFLENSK